MWWESYKNTLSVICGQDGTIQNMWYIRLPPGFKRLCVHDWYLSVKTERFKRLYRTVQAQLNQRPPRGGQLCWRHERFVHQIPISTRSHVQRWKQTLATTQQRTRSTICIVIGLVVTGNVPRHQECAAPFMYLCKKRLKFCVCSGGGGEEDVEQCCMRCLGYKAKLDVPIFKSYNCCLPAGIGYIRSPWVQGLNLQIMH